MGNCCSGNPNDQNHLELRKPEQLPPGVATYDGQPVEEYQEGQQTAAQPTDH